MSDDYGGGIPGGGSGLIFRSSSRFPGQTGLCHSRPVAGSLTRMHACSKSALTQMNRRPVLWS